MGVQNVTRVSITPVSIPPPVAVPNMSLVHQEQTEWCWAACTVMVINCYQLPSREQCDLANFLFESTRCCLEPTKFNDGCHAEDIASVYQSQHITAVRTSYTQPLSDTDKARLLSTIRDEITAKRPVELRIRTSINSAHVVMVYAFDKPDNSEDGFRYMILDSQDRPGCMTGDRVTLLDGVGKVVDSWTGIKP